MIDENAMLKMLAHPMRREILKLAVEKDRPLSPNQIRMELDKSLGYVAYHVRVLKSFGALVLVDEGESRGSIEHFYATDKAVTDFDWVRSTIGLQAKDSPQ